jgi:phosphoribosylformimino-5-aminoimidazole carboxamide ribotide isomerase
MDILNGQVVNAVRGKRSEYQPLKSILVNSSDAIVVASAFRKLGFSELYVADLDAIVNKDENVSILKEIVLGTGLKLLVDAGVEDLTKVAQLFENRVSKVIVGTETLSNLTFLKRILEFYGKEKIIVSLDLMKGKVLSKSESLSSKNALSAASSLVDLGIGKMILLDLARVGSGEGIDFDLIKEIQRSLNVKLYVGGGVRDISDLLLLKDFGVEGVLVASALHSGKITFEELAKIGEF